LIGNKKLFGSVTLLLGGTGISQIIPVLFTPLLSRIYSPGELGSLGLFMAATSLLGIISSGMFELSIMLPKSNLKAFRIVGLSVFHALLFTIFITLLLVFFFDKLDMIGWHMSWSDTVILLPLSVFSYALFQSLSYWVNRMGKYKVLSKIRIIQSLTIVGSSLLFGFLNFSFNGLIVGYFLGFVVCIISWLIIIFKRFVVFDVSVMGRLYKEYVHYPTIVMPGLLLNSAAGQTPLFFINKYFQISVAGGFSMANRLLLAPLGLFSTAVGQVFFKDMAELSMSAKELLLPRLHVACKWLMVAACIFLLPIYFFGEGIISFVLGESWAASSEFISILSLAVFVRFVVSPVSIVMHVVNGQKHLGIWQLSYFISTVLFFILFHKLPILLLLAYYSIHESFHFLMFGFLIYNRVKKFDRLKLQGDVLNMNKSIADK
jgi:teichuronic acid exporter